MAGIPSAIETDSEDVAWALQTADALWKREEYADAVVWLRRAAQAAGDAQDDDRALALARNAAELADWASRASARPRAVPAGPKGPSAAEIDNLLQSSDDDDVESIEPIEPIEPEEEEPRNVRRDARPPVPSVPDDDEVTSPDMPADGSVSSRPTVMPARNVTPAAPPPPMQLASLVPTLKPGRLTSLPPPLPPAKARVDEPVVPAFPPPRPPRATPRPPARDVREGPVGAAHVPTAAEAHAGMLDPWAEHEPTEPPLSREAEVTAERPHEVVTSAPAIPAAPVRKTPRPAAAPRAPVDPPRGPAVRTGRSEASVPASYGLAPEWPDAVHRALAQTAVIRELARDEEVSGFGLVSVLEGSVDVAATIVDAPAERLEAGAVLRARGTTDTTIALRVIGATDRARVATWTEKQVSQAFVSCPNVEQELRALGNRVQAVVGATMGPLGERLDAALRSQIAARLRLRLVGEGEVVAKQGDVVAGLTVVGAGELELVDGRKAGERVALRAGDFLFPSEVLRAGTAPRTVRGAKGGALLLVADRATAQELLVTCPPLLEILAEA